VAIKITSEVIFATNVGLDFGEAATYETRNLAQIGSTQTLLTPLIKLAVISFSKK